MRVSFFEKCLNDQQVSQEKRSVDVVISSSYPHGHFSVNKTGKILTIAHDIDKLLVRVVFYVWQRSIFRADLQIKRPGCTG